MSFHTVWPQFNKTTTQQTIETAENTKKPREWKTHAPWSIGHARYKGGNKKFLGI
jgi:hypothetical protein